MLDKAEWLHARKLEVLAELTKCESENKQIFDCVVAESAAREKQIAGLKEASKQLEDSHREELTRYLLQIKTLETLIINKDDTIDHLRAQNAQLNSSEQEKTTVNQQNYARIIELQHLLSVEKGENGRITRESTKQLQEKDNWHTLEMSKLQKRLDDEIKMQEERMRKTHHQQLSEIKKNNLQLLQKIQQEYQAITTKSVETNKQSEVDCGRLVTENTRLLATNNQNKMRILTLQSSLNAQLQQTKLLQKENELFRENSKREITFLKEEKASLAEKNKKIAEKIEELAWANRQNELRKEEDLKKIRREVDNSFQQILDKAQQQKKQLEHNNEQLRKALQEKTQQLQQMQQISLRIKEHFEQQQRELLQIKQQKETMQQQAKAALQSAPAKANEELKNQLIRKNCQTQVLHDEIKRLKSKVNAAATAQQQFNNNKELLLQENKMLLAEILFLKEKEKKGKGRLQDSKLSRSNFLGDMNSEQSKDEGELEEYKKIIEIMTMEMNEVSKSVKEKNDQIARLEALVRRYERESRDLK